MRGADEAVLFVSAATSFNGFDKSPAREGQDADAAARRPLAAAAVKPFAGAPRRARRRPRAPLRPGAARPRRAGRRPPDRRAAPRLPPRRGPRARGPRLPVRPLPARRELPPRHPAREPAGHLERGRPPALELQLDDEHQQRDELLAGGGREPLGVPRADAADDLRARAERPGDRADELRRAGLGRPPQRRPLAADGPRRQLGPGRPEVGELADGRRLALDGPLGALRLHARRRVAAGLRLAAPAGRRGVRARLARPGREGRARHGTVLLPREHVPGARRERVRHRPLGHGRRRAAAGALHERDRGLDDPRRGRRPAPRDGGRSRPAPAVPGRRAAASCRSGRGLRGARAPPPARLAPRRPPPRAQHHAGGDARARPGGPPIARAAGRRQHGLVDGLEGEPVGPARRRGPGPLAWSAISSGSSRRRARATGAGAGSTPTSSTPTRRSRSTATSA